MRSLNENFPIQLIDFHRDRLGLTHNPKVKTVGKRYSINEIGRQLLKFRKSFIPDKLK